MAQALHDTGIEEGRDIAVEWRYAGGQTGRTPALAADLAQLRLDAIVAIGDVAIQAVRKRHDNRAPNFRVELRALKPAYGLVCAQRLPRQASFSAKFVRPQSTTILREGSYLAFWCVFKLSTPRHLKCQMPPASEAGVFYFRGRFAEKSNVNGR
jgi:hypothetical protein